MRGRMAWRPAPGHRCLARVFLVSQWRAAPRANSGWPQSLEPLAAGPVVCRGVGDDGNQCIEGPPHGVSERPAGGVHVLQGGPELLHQPDGALGPEHRVPLRHFSDLGDRLPEAFAGQRGCMPAEGPGPESGREGPLVSGGRVHGVIVPCHAAAIGPACTRASRAVGPIQPILARVGHKR